ncbi:MAG: 3-deoxy-D-manno-octulosonic acid transferase [Tabrizicola sp.]|nr:3-deoxy-D-manno-octulosonic acid transferase [Tabrizicola sp.]
MRLRLFLLFWAALWHLGLPFALVYLWWRGRKDALYAQHLGERFGRVAAPPGAVWVHAVSLGEMRSAVPLVRAFLDRGESVVTTHFTPAGRREAERVFAAEIAAGRMAVIWVPFEFGWAYRRFFRAIRPKFGLVMEVEIWPRMIFSARRAGVPLFMCNAQYPTKSMARDESFPLRHDLMRGFAGALVKSDLQASRFASVGVGRIEVTGELRFDQPVPSSQLAAAAAARPVLAGGREVVTFASVVEGEDSIYLDAIAAALAAPDPPLTVYVPRKPERFDDVAALIAGRGLRMARRRDLLDGDLALRGKAGQIDILLGDSLGEMYFYIALSDLVVTGGGFTPKGAHNIIEPLALKRPVIVGPQVHTIEYPVTEAIEAGVCLRVLTPEELSVALRDWPGPEPEEIEHFFEDHAGATERTLNALDRLLTNR